MRFPSWRKIKSRSIFQTKIATQVPIACRAGSLLAAIRRWDHSLHIRRPSHYFPTSLMVRTTKNTIYNRIYLSEHGHGHCTSRDQRDPEQRQFHRCKWIPFYRGSNANSRSWNGFQRPWRSIKREEIMGDVLRRTKRLDRISGRQVQP